MTSLKVLNGKAFGGEGHEGGQVEGEEEAGHMEVTFELLCLNISPMRLMHRFLGNFHRFRTDSLVFGW